MSTTHTHDKDTAEFSRRTFLRGTGGVLAVGTVSPVQAATAVAPEAAPAPVPHTDIQVTVNGTTHRLEVEDRWTLVELLRDHLGLTGTKIGCDRGECGACTVLLDGRPVYSCSQLAAWVDGKHIDTVEGLEHDGRLSALQQAFVDNNGPQCGFCTSGQLMSATALLADARDPSPRDVRSAMTGNLCRCSNYNAIVEAVLAAAGGAHVAHGAPTGVRRPSTGRISPLTTVGPATARIDAVERVTGRATYTADVRLPGMLYGRVLRSPHPHARIRHIDVSKAEALPGVKAVITHERVPIVWGAGSVSGGRQYNDRVKEMTRHRRHLFNNPARFVGDPVAAVAAVDRHVAEEALQLISVDYEPLPFVLDPEAALEPDAPKVWPDGNLAPDVENQVQPMVTRRGDVEAGFSAADQVFEARYSTAFVHDAQMERRVCLAQWEGDKLTLYTPTQGISNCRHDTARDLGMPEDKVRIVCRYMGGGFGNKNQNQDADLIAAMLARWAGAPVALELSRREDWLGMHGRWPTVQYYKVGVKGDGTLTAVQLRGYSGMGGYRKNSGGISGLELYDCANVERRVYPVYTNRTVSGNFRAPTYPQGFFGIQSMMDDVAYRVGLDPVDFVRKNMRKPSADVQFTNYTLDECIEQAAATFDWKARWRPVPGSDPGPIKRGAGMSFMLFRSGVGRSSAILRVDATERYTLFVGITDVGRRREDDHGDDRRRGARRAALAGRGGVGRHRSLSEFRRGVRCTDHGDDRHRRRGGGPRPEASDRRERTPDRPGGAHRLHHARPRHGREATQLLRRALRRGRSGHRPRPRADHEIRGGARVGPHHQSPDGEGSDPWRGDTGDRAGAARGPAVRHTKRAAAYARLLRRAPCDASRRTGDRDDLHRDRRWPRPIRRQVRRRIGHRPGAGRRRQRHLQCDRAADEGPADYPRQDSGSVRVRSVLTARFA